MPGFFVAGAGEGARPTGPAARLVVVREDKRTLLVVEPTYAGPAAPFALVLPVPASVQRSDVRVVSRDVVDRFDRLAAPRLVELWEQDPCPESRDAGPFGGTTAHFAPRPPARPLAPFAPMARPAATRAQGATSDTAEYEFVLLSPAESRLLDETLAKHGFALPADSGDVLRPYVEGGSRFVVAKVDPAKARFDGERARLSPIALRFEQEALALPLRAGLVSAGETQDVIVHVLANDRYDVAEAPAASPPTGLEVGEEAKARFAGVYGALLDRMLKGSGGFVALEYAWRAGACDPCTAPALTFADLAALGLETPSSPAVTMTPPRAAITEAEVSGSIRNAQQAIGAIQAGYQRCYVEVLARNPNVQGEIRITATIGDNGEVRSATVSTAVGLPDELVKCATARVEEAHFVAPDEGRAGITVGAAFRPSRPYLAPDRLVLTRLHARYSKAALKSDLVLRPASAAAQPSSAAGAAPAPANAAGGEAADAGPPSKEPAFAAYQAKYVLRHAWSGPVACARPRRDVWSAVPPAAEGDAGATAEVPPEPALDLAFASREGIALEAMLKTPLAPSSPAPAPSGSVVPASSVAVEPDASASAQPAGSPSAQPTSGGGCGACASADAGSNAAHARAAHGLFAGLALLASRRRLRRRRRPR